METIRITTSQNIDIDYEIAGLGDRVLARLIDFGLFILIFILGLIIASITNGLDSKVTVILLVTIYSVLFVFYDLGCETMMNGQSVGKKVMKIKVISLDGSRPSLGQYVLRWLFRIVDFTLTSQLCGLICVAVSDKKQRVGDIVAGTTLIKTKQRVMADGLAFAPVADNYEPVFAAASQLTDKDIELIHEVINNYFKTGNNVIVYKMADKIREHLSIALPPNMDSMKFLQTVLKDYSHIIAHTDAL
jgi:uncharacterized RDD family membrane protein YckC